MGNIFDELILKKQNTFSYEQTATVSSSTDIIIIQTNSNANTLLDTFPIAIAASINRKPTISGVQSQKIDAEFISYQSYYSFNPYPWLRIDMSTSDYLGTYPITLYINFYNFAQTALPKIPYQDLDFQPTIQVLPSTTT